MLWRPAPTGKRRIWRKIHIGIDEQTLEMRAVKVTGSNIGDAPMLPEVLDQFTSDQDVGSVTADGAYDTRKCHDAIGVAVSVLPEHHVVRHIAMGGLDFDGADHLGDNLARPDLIFGPSVGTKAAQP